MQIFGLTAAALAVSLPVVAAQNSTLIYNNTQINVQSTNQYSGLSLAGYHVGAGLSYMAVQAPAVGNSFSFNFSATSAQLLDNDIAASYQLPCYILNTPQISSNAGPLECGVSDQDGDYDVASVQLPSDPSPGKITFTGISQWYICAVQSFTYGWVQGTIVGSFANSAPSGDGIQNCTSIDGIAFVVRNTTTSTSASSATMTGSSLTSSVTSATASGITGSKVASMIAGSQYSMLPVTSTSNPVSATRSASTMATVIVPCPSVSNNPNSNATATTNVKIGTTAALSTSGFVPVATWTGAASALKASTLSSLTLAIIALLL